MTVEDVWVHFKQEQLEEYNKLRSDNEAASSFLASILNLTDYRFDARHAIKLDYACYVLEFAREQKYGAARTASLFNICQRTLQACIAGASLHDAEATLKMDLLGVCRAKPGLDSPFFSPDQVSRIGIFLATTLFHHYRLYQYCFSLEQDLTEYTSSLMVETAIVPPFDDALPESEWNSKLEEARAQEQAAKQAAQDAELARIEADKQEQQVRKKAEELAARQAELAKKPATLEEAVEQMVALRLEQEKAVLSAEYKAKEEALLTKIQALEVKLETPETPVKK